MNRCGKNRTPFLFGVDFEIDNGFFIENPLSDTQILFSVNHTTNAGNTIPSCPKPKLKILDTDSKQYIRQFNIVRNGLLHGDSFLLNLTRRTRIETNLSLEQIFRLSHAPYKLWMPGHFVCFSPETFVRIDNGTIATYPMKGTVDATIPDAEKHLLDNYKELCEHYTVVDLMRNDLSTIASNVSVRRFRYVQPVKTLHGEILQSSSEITGKLPRNYESSLGDIIFRILPAGSISGAPKPSTIALIRQAEKIRRGFYTGIFGYFDGAKLDSAVMIRFIEQEGERYYFRSGGGITINSHADEEFRETIDKIYLSIP